MLNDLENLYDGHQLWCHVSAGAAVSKNMDGSGPRGSFFSTVDAGVSQEIKKKKSSSESAYSSQTGVKISN